MVCTQLTKNYGVACLGDETDKGVTIQQYLTQKNQGGSPHLVQLITYWKTRSNNKCKFIVFNAIIRSKVVYSLETIHYSKAMYKKIDAFQYRGLSTIISTSEPSEHRY